VATLAGTILAGALRKHATDIHIEATGGAVEVKYRIRGILYPAMAPLGMHWHAPLVSRFEAGATPADGEDRIAHGECRLESERRFTLRLARRAVDFRVSVLTSALGETMVIRIPEEARS
jgi:type IV pilus assembly protein PilB